MENNVITIKVRETNSPVSMSHTFTLDTTNPLAFENITHNIIELIALDIRRPHPNHRAPINEATLKFTNTGNVKTIITPTTDQHGNESTYLVNIHPGSN